MKIIRVQDQIEGGKIAFTLLKDSLAKGAKTLGLATGSSPISFYPVSYTHLMGSVLQVLYPWQLGDGKNNDSLVLYGRLLNRTFLFTGDLEKEGENEIIERYPQLRVDYLKAGHHGSNTSSLSLIHICMWLFLPP